MDDPATLQRLPVSRVEHSARHSVLRFEGPDSARAIRAFGLCEPGGVSPRCHPGKSKQQIRTLAPSEFVRQHGKNGTGDAVDAIAVAAVGSSALGTGALARNIADHLGRPVAGVVSGFGMSDLLTEAMGGWFVLGSRNALRDSLARLFDMYQLKDHVRDSESHQAMKEHFKSTGIDTDRFIYGSPDSGS